ncbi:MAG: PPC domain-containing protein [Chloroflexi bacterium]|nr:PPC domain-containing protein [Chloroflexota bacterium]MCC6893779.1 PPC domain-containing protein [Anaerolineae bacterium]
MRSRLLWKILVIMLLAASAGSSSLLAQDTEDEQTNLIYGAQITGEISRNQPRSVYYFDGSRGEVVAINLRTTRGDLDPILTLIDSTGQVVMQRDDGAGDRNISIPAFTIPQSLRYYIVVGRFGMALGTTTGSFELNIERIGVSGQSGSALRYGDSVINNITNMSPQVYYSFQAQQGDIIDVLMQKNSGTLDPYLQVVNSSARVIAESDDIDGSGSLDAGISGLVIEETGTYVIVATRYGEAAGTSTGRYILTVAEADNSGLGNAAATALTIPLNGTADSEITNQNWQKFFAFDAQQDDLISVQANRSSGSLDAFVIIADSNLQELVSDDDGGGGQNAKIDQFRIPAAGRYYVIVTRADRQAGTTEGGYKLGLQNLGNAFDGVPEGMQRISYGTTITGRIDEITPETTFAFFGTKGDAITLSLNRGDGDLDPTLTLLNGQQVILTQDDDSGGGQNARITRYVLQESGTYYIRASRFSGTDGNPNTQGSFILVLARIVQ